MEPENEVLMTVELWDGEKVEIYEGTLNLYDGSCALCKWFRGESIRQSEIDNSWVDDNGSCVRFPPVFVGGDQFKWPDVYGHNECGEYAKGWKLKG